MNVALKRLYFYCSGSEGGKMVTPFNLVTIDICTV